MKNLRHKLIIALAALLALMYLSSDFALLDIEDTAIVVAMGVDKHEDGVEVTAQIGVPQATQQVSQNNDTVISTKGKTVMDAIAKMGANTGWHPKLSFCNLILVGRDLARDGLGSLIDNLILDERVQNSAMIALCDTTAKEVLRAVTPLDSISSFAIQKILLKNDRSTGTIADVNIKDFAVGLHGKGGFSYMPLIRTVKGTTDGDMEGGSGGTTAQSDVLLPCLFKKNNNDNGHIGRLSDNGKSGGTSGGDKKTVVFNATSTAIFSGGRMVGELPSEKTVAFNLLRAEADRVILPSGDDGLMLEVYKSKKRVRVEYGVKPTLVLDLKLWVRPADGDQGVSEDGDSRRYRVDGEELDGLEKNLKDAICDMTEEALKAEIDIFGIRDMTYRNYHKMYEDYKTIPLKSFLLRVNVHALSQE